MRDRPDYSKKLSKIRVRSLVIGADDDLAIPVEESRKLAGGLHEATLKMISAAGHLVMLEQPEAVNRALMEFLSAA
jgi:pimeloyl-ACP methyl ester carboxylesterase